MGHKKKIKGRLIETSLGGLHFCGSAVRTSTWKPLQLSWRMVPASVGHTSFFGVRPRSGHLQAIGCTKWLHDGCFTTMDVPAHAVVVAFLFLWECRFLLCCWIAQLLRWLVICVSRVSCDFVGLDLDLDLGWAGGTQTICSKDG